MDDTSPATKGDLQQLKGAMKGDLQQLEQVMKGDLQKLAQSMNERFARIDGRFDRVHEDIDRVLSILVKVKDKTDNHEKRIVRLEKAIA